MVEKNPYPYHIIQIIIKIYQLERRFNLVRICPPVIKADLTITNVQLHPRQASE